MSEMFPFNDGWALSTVCTRALPAYYTKKRKQTFSERAYFAIVVLSHIHMTDS